MRGVSGHIIDEALAWPGVERGKGRFGSVTLNVGRRELGHFHGDSVADIPLPRALRDQLVDEHTVLTHRFAPDSGWVSVPLTDAEAEQRVIGLLRRNYERAVAKQR